MNVDEAHADFMKILSYDHPADAIAYVHMLSPERRNQLDIYVKASAEISRRAVRRGYIMFIGLCIVIALGFLINFLGVFK